MMRLLQPPLSVVAGGHQEDSLVTLRLGQELLREEGGVREGVVVEAVPDGGLHWLYHQHYQD